MWKNKTFTCPLGHKHESEKLLKCCLSFHKDDKILEILAMNA